MFIKHSFICQEMHFFKMLIINYYDQQVLKSEHQSGRNPPTHPNSNVVQILKSVKKWTLPHVTRFCLFWQFEYQPILNDGIQFDVGLKMELKNSLGSSI